MNGIKQNVEGIDLLDNTNKIIAQVSSTSTKNKIESSLNKKILLEFTEYRFKFISIAKDASNLKNKTFENPYSILFNPLEDIIDINVILKNIINKSIEEQKNIFEFIKKELGTEVDIVKMDSNLTAIINILSLEALSDVSEGFETNSFEIEKKIKYNDLKSVKMIIDDYKVYYYKLDEKYKEFDKQGANKSFTVLQTVRKQYIDTENKKDVYHLVKEYLINNEVLITLIITEDLNDKDSEEIIIERNFLARKKIIRRINGVQLVEKDFEPRLLELIIKGNNIDKPSFRQIVSHNIRYKDEGINNTLKTLDKFTSDAEYETLYLYLLGCIFDKGATKQSILMKIKQEESFKERLEKKQTKNEYEIALSMIDDEIEELNNKKSNFNLNENFEADLNSLNSIKYKINKQSSILSNLKIRKELIEETNNEMVGDISKVDLKQLEMIYSQAIHNIKGIQRTFEDLVEYHNNMISEKIKFITAELPVLNKKIENEVVVLNGLLKQEKDFSLNISKGDSFEELEKLIVDLNDKKELMHGNQLIKVSEFIKNKNIQLVASYT